MKILDNDLDIKCGWCRKVSKLKEWNDLTYSYCVNREMKRLYTPLNKIEAFKKEVYYCCPKCERWNRVEHLSIVNTDDEKLKKLGNKPVISI